MAIQDVLFYDKPAAIWEEALPIGNGRLGAMIKGTTSTERLWMNEDSVWYGGPQQRINPSARSSLPHIRELLDQGKVVEAEALMAKSLTSMPQGMRHYEPLGDVYLHFGHGTDPDDDSLPDTTHSGSHIEAVTAAPQVTHFRRELVLNSGLATTKYSIDGVNFTREYFASVVDQVICVRVTASKKGSIAFQARLNRGDHEDPNKRINTLFDSLEHIENGLVLGATLGGRGAIEASMAMKVIARGEGTIISTGDEVQVTNADEAIILIAGETTFRNEDAKQASIERVEEAAQISYDNLIKRHTARFCALYERVSLDLGEPSLHPTDVRIRQLRDGSDDNNLLALMFQYGRYLLISSSLDNSLPANLQGIWNPHFMPVWGSKFTLNINVEMNYWLAEVTNLSDCHLPLFELIKRVSVNGKKTATTMYGSRGWVAHHNTDIWAQTDPQDRHPPSSYWTLGGAWLCLHLWEHYLFTKDEEFLAEIFPILRDAATFFVDTLILKDGHLVTSPSVSPENSYILPGTRTAVNNTIGSSSDSQILVQLFSSLVQAGQVLGQDISLYVTVLSKLRSPAIGSKGQLLEWIEEFEEAEPGHRHVSHLFGLYPGTTLSTAELQQAARVTLQRRLAAGSGHTGWSRAWMICLYARLRDPAEALLHTRSMVSHCVLNNLLANHPPFQIDGNFGATAGIAEMLLQSHNPEVGLYFLPCVPDEWHSGSFTGLCARGGITVSLSWKNGKLVWAKLRAKHDSELKCHIDQRRLESGKGSKTLSLKAGELLELSASW